MATLNIGSIATRIQNRIDNIPTAVSGEVIPIVDETRIFMEEYTNQSIGSTAIAEIYQPAMTDLATARVAAIMEMQGLDVSSFRLGDLDVNKGADSAAQSVSRGFERSGMEKLKAVGRKAPLFRVIG